MQTRLPRADSQLALQLVKCPSIVARQMLMGMPRPSAPRLQIMRGTPPTSTYKWFQTSRHLAVHKTLLFQSMYAACTHWTITESLLAGGITSVYFFYPKHRLEKNLLTAGVVLANVLSTDVPVQIVSLDLSKAFDRRNWMMQCSYHHQHGRVQTGTDLSIDFRT